MSRLAGSAMRYALLAEQKHVREASPNWGPEVGAYLKAAGIDTPAPWCAAFVFWCVKQACAELGVPDPLAQVHNHAQVQSYYEYFAANGMLVPAAQAQFGDLVLFRFTDAHYDHIGFNFDVPQARNGSLIVESVDGNTSDPSDPDPAHQREGVEVCRKTRTLAPAKVAFARFDRSAQ